MMKFRSRSKSSKGSRDSTGSRKKADFPDISPRSVTSSTHADSLTEGSSPGEHRRPSASDLDNLRDQQIRLPITSDGRIQPQHDANYRHRTRSLSAQRASQLLANGGGRMTVLGREERLFVQDDAMPVDLPRRSHSTGRARSTGRAVHPRPVQYVESIGSSEVSARSDRKRKSKMEKIRQLQAKNELYKEEFKRVQKDRKKLRKDLEAKSLEVASLTKEIDEQIAETSRLKAQLSDAMQQLDRTDEDVERDKTTINKLAKELAQAKQELSLSLSRVSTLKDDVADLREYVRRKDEQIESLTEAVSSQEGRIVSLEEENRNLALAAENGHKDGRIVSNLVEENNKLQEELGATLQRAATMVKEREEAISDLLRENDEIKDVLSAREQQEHSSDRVTQNDLDQMRVELDTVNASLEQVQDRNVLLEEEIEAWLSRGTEMEGMLERLNSDLDSWQKKAKAAEDELSEVQGKLVDAKAQIESGKVAFIKADTKHKEQLAKVVSQHKEKLAKMDSLRQEQLAELEMKHRAAITETQEKAIVDKMEKNSSADYQQAMLLQAVADRQRKASSSSSGGGGQQQSSWRRFMGNNSSEDADDSLDDNQKRIKELQSINTAQEEEIKQLKSELVRLRSSFNEATYMSNKKIDRLTEENEAYAKKTASLEKLLEQTE